MLNAFEERLVELLIDRLAGNSRIAAVTRPWDGMPDPSGTAIQVLVSLLSGEPTELVGDDRREVTRQNGSFSLHPVLRLEGEIAVHCSIAETQGGAQGVSQRRNLMGGFDDVLSALNDETIRNGRAFLKNEDLGFELDGFRLTRASGSVETETDMRRLSAYYNYAGSFWPVAPAVQGDVVSEIPVRLAQTPAVMSTGLSARAGGDDVTIPVVLDRRTFVSDTDGAGGIDADGQRVVAHLVNASSPGQLIGDTTGMPAGHVSYTPDQNGAFEVVYRPPADLTGSTRVAVEVGLFDGADITVRLGRTTLTVKGS